MFTVDKKNLCELCFSELHPKMKKCPFCDAKPNNEQYPTALKEGTILVGRYAVGRVLGKGGFGITYLCYDLKEKKAVAIKEYLPDTLAHRNSGETAVSSFGGEKEQYFKSGAKKFYDEAKLVSRFNGNPNIISVYEFFFENNTTYFVMEYLDGIDFKQYIHGKGGKVGIDEALYIVNRVTEALMIVHSTDILHRDISPDNIFLCANGDVKLIDFGAARQVVGEESKSLSIILKQGFAPFEQYQKKGNQGPWTDIYALGATLYYAITGIVIDDAMTRFDDDTLSLDTADPALATVICKMLAVRAENRYRNVFDVKQAVCELGIEEKQPILPEKKKVGFCEKCGKLTDDGRSICSECEEKANKKRKITKKDDEKERINDNAEQEEMVFDENTTNIDTTGGEENSSDEADNKEKPGINFRKLGIIIASVVIAGAIVFAAAELFSNREPEVRMVQLVQSEEQIVTGEGITLGNILNQEDELKCKVSILDETVLEIKGNTVDGEYPYDSGTEIIGKKTGRCDVHIEAVCEDGKNITEYEKTVTIVVTMSQAEKDRIEASVDELKTLFDAIKEDYRQKVADTTVNHANCAYEEAALGEAITGFEDIIANIFNQEQLDNAKDRYENVVVPAKDSFNQAFEKALEIAREEYKQSQKKAAAKQKKATNEQKKTNTTDSNAQTEENINTELTIELIDKAIARKREHEISERMKGLLEAFGGGETEPKATPTPTPAPTPKPTPPPRRITEWED